MNQPMTPVRGRLLLGYLLAALTAAFYAVCTLWSEPPSGSRELRLLLLVLAAGAAGSCTYALKSLANYRGDGKLYQSWSAYYLVQPFEGASIAFLLYTVIRGGLLSGGRQEVNQFGICAVAGLAGAFSDAAYLKLREVFQVLFKPQDDRGGKSS